jgi:FlaA1/EpsC-like NDP-sugar epimerase
MLPQISVLGVTEVDFAITQLRDYIMAAPSSPRILERLQVPNAFSGDRATRVLVVGSGPNAAKAIEVAKEVPARIVVGILDQDGPWDTKHQYSPIPWLGRMTDLRHVILNHRITEIQVALSVESSLTWAPDLRAAASEFGIRLLFFLEGRQSVVKSAPRQDQGQVDDPGGLSPGQ